MAIRGNNNLIKINDPNIINLYNKNKFKVNPNLLKSLDHSNSNNWNQFENDQNDVR